MNRIEKIEVFGFWGDRTIELQVHPDVNFLIGMNGSGKTTFIRLVSAALTADISELNRLPFESIKITLKNFSGLKKPSIVVEKVLAPPRYSALFRYSIRNSSRGKVAEYHLGEHEQRFTTRRARHLRRPSSMRQREDYRDVSAHLNSLINISWLSIHRSRLVAERNEDINYDSSVDIRLNKLVNQIIRYHSELSQQSSKLLEDFQKEIFLSLLKGYDNVTSIFTFEIEEIRSALVEIFLQFSISERSDQEIINRHFDKASSIREKLLENSKVTLSTNEISTLFSTLRIKTIGEKWRALEEERKEIFSPIRIFRETIDTLYQRKQIQISEEGELIAITTTNKRLKPMDLSSGEKQLLIFLGEALLQRRQPQIYIADEPELSLHVAWQEQLVRKLRAINPNAQVLFATHSPDIVGPYNDKVFEMGDLLN